MTTKPISWRGWYSFRGTPQRERRPNGCHDTIKRGPGDNIPALDHDQLVRPTVCHEVARLLDLFLTLNRDRLNCSPGNGSARYVEFLFASFCHELLPIGLPGG